MTLLFRTSWKKGFLPRRAQYAGRVKRIIPFLLVALLCLGASAAPFTVATYNLEFYVDAPTLGNPPKTAESRKFVRASIKRLNPDVIGLAEVGSPAALQELQRSLAAEGLQFPHSEYLQGADTNLHLAFLSRLPIVSRNPHTNESFLYQGRRFHVLRGFGEIEVAAARDERVTLLSAHLKSRRQMAEADQQGVREAEAAMLREQIDAFFQRQPRGKLVVLGDFNDDVSSRTVRTILGKGKTRLFDPRPAEQNGDSLADARGEPRRIYWTHYFARDEIYARIDYILVSPNLREAVNPRGSYVLAMPDWGMASDHRPVCVRLDLGD